MAGVGNSIECALVVFGFESEVAFHHEDDLRLLKDFAFVDAIDVTLEKGELLFRLCQKQSELEICSMKKKYNLPLVPPRRSTAMT